MNKYLKIFFCIGLCFIGFGTSQASYGAVDDLQKNKHFNTHTNHQTYKPVLNTFTRQAEKMVKVWANGELINTTYSHPFRVNGQWIVAGKLQKGDQIQIPAQLEASVGVSNFARSSIEVDSVLNYLETTPVYNFEVEDYHTYYVGNQGFLVHNWCAIDKLKALTGEAKTGFGTFMDFAVANGIGIAQRKVLYTKLNALSDVELAKFFKSFSEAPTSYRTFLVNGSSYPNAIESWKIFDNAGPNKLRDAIRAGDDDYLKALKELADIKKNNITIFSDTQWEQFLRNHKNHRPTKTNVTSIEPDDFPSTMDDFPGQTMVLQSSKLSLESYILAAKQISQSNIINKQTVLNRLVGGTATNPGINYIGTEWMVRDLYTNNLLGSITEFERVVPGGRIIDAVVNGEYREYKSWQNWGYYSFSTRVYTSADVGFVTQLAKDLKGGQTFIWKFEPKGIFASSATVKSNVRQAMMNQLSYLNQNGILDMQAKATYFEFDLINDISRQIVAADIDKFIQNKFSGIFK